MRPYRDIAILAGAQIVCFLLLTHLEPAFFLIHLYQSIVYTAILVLLFYMEDRWAYMIGMLASVVWLAMAYTSGMLGRAIEQLFAPRTSSLAVNLVGLLALVTPAQGFMDMADRQTQPDLCRIEPCGLFIGCQRVTLAQ